MSRAKISPRMDMNIGKVVSAGFAFVATTIIIIGVNCSSTNGYPASIDALAHLNKFGENHKDHNDQQMAEQEFRHFIHLKDSPNPTLVGEIKPNASDNELAVLRSKIASAISKMQETENNSPSIQTSSSSGQMNGECFIEITKVERIPGKCHRVNNGIPICQAENYMAINTQCG